VATRLESARAGQSREGRTESDTVRGGPLQLLAGGRGRRGLAGAVRAAFALGSLSESAHGGALTNADRLEKEVGAGNTARDAIRASGRAATGRVSYLSDWIRVGPSDWIRVGPSDWIRVGPSDWIRVGPSDWIRVGPSAGPGIPYHARRSSTCDAPNVCRDPSCSAIFSTAS
jgi:hypothetical protein